MRTVKIAGVVLEGHKGSAVEVPFDPAERFGIRPERLRRGRRGHHVRGTIGRLRFESEIVPRSNRFWMVVPDSVLAALGLAPGDPIELRVEPCAAAGSVNLRRPARRSSS